MEIEKEKVGDIVDNKFFLEKKELRCTLINLVVIKMFFTEPRTMIINSGNAAWIQMIYVSLLSFLIALFIRYFNKYIGMENVFDVAEKIGGKWLRTVVGVSVLLVLIINLSANIRIFPESIKTVLLPNTPIKVILLIFVIAISFGAYMGIYAICRIHALFMPIMAIVMLGLFFVLLPNIQPQNIFPIAGTGTYNIFIKGTKGISVFADIMIIYIIKPFCKNKEDINFSTSYAFFISGLSSALMIITYVLIYPYPVSKDFIMPIYQLARIAKIGLYFQRFEAFSEFAWSIAMMLYASFYLFVICYTFTQTFKTKYYKEVIIPIVLLCSSIAFIPKNFIVFLGYENAVLSFVLPVLYVIPALLGIFYSIKQRGMKEGETA